MAKYCGKIGYAETVEVRPDVFQPRISEVTVYGDVIRNSRHLQSQESGNDTFSVGNELSILADPVLLQNFHNIRYAEFMGTNWKVSSVDVQYPRLILSLGGVYNGKQTRSK